MASHLSFQHNVSLGQMFDFWRLELQPQTLSLSKECIETENNCSVHIHGCIVKDSKSLLKALNVSPCNLMGLLLDQSPSLECIKSFIMPSVDQYLLFLYEFQTANCKISREVTFHNTRYVNHVESGIVAIVRVICHRGSDIGLKAAENFLLREVEADFTCHDYQIETMVNWRTVQRHETLKDAINYIHVMASSVNPCPYRYHLNTSQGNGFWQESDAHQDVILDSLYWHNYGFNMLERFLLTPFRDAVVPQQYLQFENLGECENYLGHCFNLLLETFQWQTIVTVFENSKYLLKLFADFRNAVNCYLKFRLLCFHPQNITSIICASYQFGNVLRQVKHLCSYPLRVFDGRLFYFVQDRFDQALEHQGVKLRNVNGISALVKGFDEFRLQGYRIICCATDGDRSVDRVMLVNKDGYNVYCGVVTVRKIERYISPVGSGTPLFESKCSCSSTNFRNWICGGCAELMRARQDGVYCRCGKSKKEDCGFECFSPLHAEREGIFRRCMHCISNAVNGASKVESSRPQSSIGFQGTQNEDTVTLSDNNSFDHQLRATSADQYSRKYEKRRQSNNSFILQMEYTEDENSLPGCRANLEASPSRLQSTEEELSMKPPVNSATDDSENKSKFPSIQTVNNGRQLQEVPATTQATKNKAVNVAVDWNETQSVNPDSGCSSKDGLVNILLVGKMGVGKSTLLNAFNVYLMHNTPEEARGQPLECTLPVKFNVFNEDYSETVVEVPADDDNEIFHDLMDTNKQTTQRCKSHSYKYNDRTINFIDTPGITATNRNQVVHDIKDQIMSLTDIHGICFVMKPNESKLDQQMENVMKEFILFFPRSILDKVFFFMTQSLVNSLGSFFGPGDSMQPLKLLANKLKESNKIELPLRKPNIFCFDNEAFRFLCAESKEVCYTLDQDRYALSYKESAASMHRFMDTVCSKKHVKVKDIDLRLLLTQVIPEMGKNMTATRRKKLASQLRGELYLSYYFCVQKLAELSMDEVAADLIKKFDQKVLANLSKARQIGEGFVINNLTLKKAAELHKRHAESKPQFDALLFFLES